MRKYLVVASIALLITVPRQLLCMNQEEISPASTKPKESTSVVRLYLSSQFEEIQRRFPSCDEIDDPKVLRTGIFELTQLITQATEQDLDAMKKTRRAMYNRLAILKGTKHYAKKFCYSVIDDISDSEEEPEESHLTRRNFLKHQTLSQKMNEEESEKASYASALEKLRKVKEEKAHQVEYLQQQLEKAQQEDRELDGRVAVEEEELKALKLAHSVLHLSTLTQQQKMKLQKTKLNDEIKAVTEEIARLEDDLQIFSVSEDVHRKKDQLSVARKKLGNLQVALSYLKKDFATTAGKTGTFANLAWGLGLYDYADPEEETPSHEGTKITAKVETSSKD